MCLASRESHPHPALLSFNFLEPKEDKRWFTELYAPSKQPWNTGEAGADSSSTCTRWVRSDEKSRQWVMAFGWMDNYFWCCHPSDRFSLKSSILPPSPEWRLSIQIRHLHGTWRRWKSILWKSRGLSVWAASLGRTGGHSQFRLCLHSGKALIVIAVRDNGLPIILNWCSDLLLLSSPNGTVSPDDYFQI
jgi:hypothetical protein